MLPKRCWRNLGKLNAYFLRHVIVRVCYVCGFEVRRFCQKIAYSPNQEVLAKSQKKKRYRTLVHLLLEDQLIRFRLGGAQSFYVYTYNLLPHYYGDKGYALEYVQVHIHVHMHSSSCGSLVHMVAATGKQHSFTTFLF